MEIVSNKDFEGLINISNLSPFEMLLLVAEKASEKEKKAVNNPEVVEEHRIDILMQEKRVLPFDLNSAPSTSKQQRTTPANKRRCSPIDVDAYIPNSNPSTSKQRRTAPGKRHRRTPSNEIINVERPRAPPAAVLPQEPPLVPPEMFLRRIQELGGSNPEFMILKTITNTDTKPFEGRLSMPLSKCKVHFKNWVDVPVMVIEPNLDVCKLTFTTWNKLKCYALKTGWRQVLVRNPDIRPDNFMHVWRFQLPSLPDYGCGFALVNI